MPRLTIRSSAGGQIAHELTEETNTVGRSPENSIRVDDPSVSGRHAEIIFLDGNCYVRDLGSTNGTSVNDARTTETRLRAGDKLRFGAVEACYECDVVAPAQPLPPPEVAVAQVGEFSARPADFANASPFPNRKKENDPLRLAVLGLVSLAILAFVASMIAVLQMHGPSF